MREAACTAPDLLRQPILRAFGVGVCLSGPIIRPACPLADPRNGRAPTTPWPGLDVRHMSDIDHALPFSKDAIRRFQSETPIAAETVELNSQALSAIAHLRDDFVSPRMLCGIWRGVELGLFLIAGLVTLVLGEADLSDVRLSQIGVVLLGSILGVAAIEGVHGYELTFLRGPISKFWRIVLGWGLTVGLLTTALALFGAELLAGSELFAWFALALAAIALGRLVL